MRIPKPLKDKIDKRKAEGRLRELINLDHLVDFYSNDYFGLASLPFESNLKMGSTGSRLISGNTPFIESVEKELADFYGYEHGLTYASGLDANLGILACIPERGDTVILDTLCHASIRDGVRLSFAKSFTFRHNDMDHLRQRLERASGTVYVVVESVYSMDGDIAPLEDIVALCNEFNAYLIVDEAHAGGMIGEGGKGLTHKLGLDEHIFIKLITFSKAYGSPGAIILCSAALREFLINYSRTFIYTSALSDFGIGRIQQVVHKVAAMDAERQALDDNVKYFREIAKAKNLNILESDTPIQAIVIPEITDLVKRTEILIDAGFAVRAISVPTVPEGTERIRLCVHSYNTKAEIKALLEHF